MEKRDFKTGNIILENDTEKQDLIAAVYDENDNLYFINSDNKIFCKSNSGEVKEITELNERKKIQNLFKAPKTDIIKEENVIEKNER